MTILNCSKYYSTEPLQNVHYRSQQLVATRHVRAEAARSTRNDVQFRLEDLETMQESIKMSTLLHL